MLLRYTLPLLALCAGERLFAQVHTDYIPLDSTFTQSVSDRLAGPGVMVLGAYYYYLPDQIGGFTDSIGSIGMTDGIVMATGMRQTVEGPNFVQNQTFGGGYQGMMDGDLSFFQQPPVPQSDASSLIIDFVPFGDSLHLNYVFASEEYNEFVCATVNDIMGIFLWGPGISGIFMNGAINIAYVPGTTLPVCVNTVNLGVPGYESDGLCYFYQGWEQDSVYYNDNTNGQYMQMDGYTNVFTASAAVTPGATYHIKIVIADADDTDYDSAVFLEAGSLDSEITTALPSMDPSSNVHAWFDPSANAITLTGLDPAVGPVLCNVIDAAGRCVAIGAATQQGQRWDLPVHAAKGMYVVRVTQGDQVITTRVVLP
jgi:hypothetical protein